MTETCYMCDAASTSREHVPPKCLFPESKDVNGQHFRENLITVPSCDIHNSKKSKDDEFLMVSTAGVLGNNSVGYQHKFGKVDRAIRRSSNRLLEKVFLKKQHYTVKTKNNDFIEVIWGTPDYKRLLSCYEHISYGIYHHHFGKRFIGELKIIPGYFHKEDINARNFNQFIRDKTELELKNVKKYGSNNEVFYYQFTERDLSGLLLLKICLYGGIDTYISFIPEGVNLPGNLGMELINTGVHTIITLGDKVYEFNKES